MNAADQKTLRLSILRWCQRKGISRALVLAYARGEGFRGRDLEDDVRAELDFLSDPAVGLIRAEVSPVEPNDPLYKITAAGRNELTSQGE